MIRRNKKDLFLKIAGRRYNPRLCRGFRRQLILVPYAATRVHAPSPPAKQASSDIITVTFAVLPGRRRRFRIQLTKDLMRTRLISSHITIYDAVFCQEK